MMRYEPPEARQYLSKIPVVDLAYAGNHRLSQLQDREPSSAFDDARKLTQRGDGIDDVADAETDRRAVSPSVPHRNSDRIAAYQSDASLERGAAHLVAPDRQHGRGEVHTDDRNLG